MSMFSLHEQPAKILNHNPSPVLHGEDLVLAGVLKVQVVVAAANLAAFDDQLPGFLFRTRRDGDAALQAEIAGQADAEVSRRLPQLAPLQWDEKFPGFRLEITKGMGLQEPIVLPMRDLSKFEFEPVDGGLVKITFNAAGTYDSTLISGELDGLQRRQVEITLEPPKAEAVAEVQQGLPGVEPGGKAVLVTGISLDENKSKAQFVAECSLSDGKFEIVGPWAYRPTLDEIAVALFKALEASVEFTPAVRDSYEAAAAA